MLAHILVMPGQAALCPVLSGVPTLLHAYIDGSLLPTHSSRRIVTTCRFQRCVEGRKYRGMLALLRCCFTCLCNTRPGTHAYSQYALVPVCLGAKVSLPANVSFWMPLNCCCLNTTDHVAESQSIAAYDTSSACARAVSWFKNRDSIMQKRVSRFNIITRRQRPYYTT